MVRSRHRRRILASMSLAALLGSAVGCGEHDRPSGLTKQAVALDSVPEPVRKAASKALPGIGLNEAWKNLGAGGKLESYELRGKTPSSGKIREVRVSLTGEILETE